MIQRASGATRISLQNWRELSKRGGVPGQAGAVMDNMRRFPAPWAMEEDEDGFKVRDTSGFVLVGIPHRDDLHQRAYQYAESHLSRDEERPMNSTPASP